MAVSKGYAKSHTHVKECSSSLDKVSPKQVLLSQNLLFA